MARTIATILAASLASFAVVGLFAVQVRTVAATMGILPVPDAAMAAEAFDDPNGEVSAGRDGAITAAYCSEPVAFCDPRNPSGRTSTSLVLYDAWFLEDAGRYNHDLATSCAVLSAVCNSESRFYSSDGGEAPYAELALGALGFEHIRTESYALRSTVLDQISALVNGSDDVAAYTFASKPLAGGGAPSPSAADGRELTAGHAAPTGDTLVFVGIRGSYGAEWVSNFDFFDGTQDGSDHRGFKAAEREVARALEGYLAEIGADPARTRVLITGHSRGGAIGDLLAADLIDRAGASPLARDGGVYAYTFAAPCSTRADERGGDVYAGIFNIVNPSDLVPQLPLSTWGFGRYGTTVELPGAQSAGFDTSLAVMQQAYRENTGLASSYSTDALAALGSFEDGAARQLPTPESFLNPLGVVTAVQTLIGVDLGLAIASHYPDTYIAWMQAVDGSALTFSHDA